MLCEGDGVPVEPRGELERKIEPLEGVAVSVGVPRGEEPAVAGELGTSDMTDMLEEEGEPLKDGEASAIRVSDPVDVVMAVATGDDVAMEGLGEPVDDDDMSLGKLGVIRDTVELTVIDAWALLEADPGALSVLLAACDALEVREELDEPLGVGVST